MENRLFVGNLSWNTSEESLREAFEAFGELRSATIVTDRETGQSRGFGFVEYVSDSDAKAAIEEMHEQDLDGRTLNVNVAKERPQRSGGGGGGGYGGGGGGGDRGGRKGRGGRRRD